MTVLEKIKSIKDRLLLSDLAICEVLNVKKKEINKLQVSEDILDRISSVFNIDKDILLDDDKDVEQLCMKYHVDMNKYENIFKAYSEILKNYFINSCHFYVLTKLKNRNMVTSFIDLFIKNDKKSIINEMNSFEPSYLVSKHQTNLLVRISNSFLEVCEIDLDSDGKSFIYGNYRYKKANEITLK